MQCKRGSRRVTRGFKEKCPKACSKARPMLIPSQMMLSNKRRMQSPPHLPVCTFFLDRHGRQEIRKLRLGKIVHTFPFFFLFSFQYCSFAPKMLTCLRVCHGRFAHAKFINIQGSSMPSILDPTRRIPTGFLRPCPQVWGKKSC